MYFAVVLFKTTSLANSIPQNTADGKQHPARGELVLLQLSEGSLASLLMENMPPLPTTFLVCASAKMHQSP